jgi:hypothetical protein
MPEHSNLEIGNLVLFPPTRDSLVVGFFFAPPVQQQERSRDGQCSNIEVEHVVGLELRQFLHVPSWNLGYQAERQKYVMQDKTCASCRGCEDEREVSCEAGNPSGN